METTQQCGYMALGPTYLTAGDDDQATNGSIPLQDS